jgi:hypothetical protein
MLTSCKGTSGSIGFEWVITVSFMKLIINQELSASRGLDTEERYIDNYLCFYSILAIVQQNILMPRAVGMAKRKVTKTKDELECIKEEIIHEFHVFCMDIIGHLRVVEEGINNFSGKLDIFHEEIKQAMDNGFQKVMRAITSLSDNIDAFREEIKTKI